MADYSRIGVRQIMPLPNATTYSPSFENPDVAKMSRAEISALNTSPFVKNTKAMYVDGHDMFRRRQMQQDLAKIPILPLNYNNPKYNQPTVRPGYESPSHRLETDYTYNHFDRKKPRGQASKEYALDMPRHNMRGLGQIELINRNKDKFLELQSYRARRFFGGGN